METELSFQHLIFGVCISSRFLGSHSGMVNPKILNSDLPIRIFDFESLSSYKALANKLDEANPAAIRLQVLKGREVSWNVAICTSIGRGQISAKFEWK